MNQVLAKRVVMARSLNKVMLLGNLGNDPETRFTNNGAPIARFSLATKRRWRDNRTEEWREETDWHDVVSFGRNAEIVGEYLSKGRQCLVEGELRTSSWEREGVKNFRTEVFARNIILLGGSGGQGRGGGGYSGSPPQGGSGRSSKSGDDEFTKRSDRRGGSGNQGSQSSTSPGNGDNFDDLDDDIPF